MFTPERFPEILRQVWGVLFDNHHRPMSLVLNDQRHGPETCVHQVIAGIIRRHVEPDAELARSPRRGIRD